MIELVFSFIESRWKPFTVVFSFFVIGIADAECLLLFHSGELSRRSLMLVAIMNVVALGYLAWLCTRTSFYIQPRSKAIIYALAAFLLGATLAIVDGFQFVKSKSLSVN